MMELEHQRRRTTPDGVQPDPESRKVEDREKSWRSGTRSSRSKVNGSRFATELSVLRAALRDFSTSESNSNWIWRGSHGSGAVLTHSGAVLADSNEFMVMSWNSGMFGEDYAVNWTGSRDSIMVGTDSDNVRTGSLDPGEIQVDSGEGKTRSSNYGVCKANFSAVAAGRRTSNKIGV